MNPLLEMDESGVAPETGDLRMTRQRREVYQILQERHDHPTAADLHAAVKERMPSISLATVYNCLETMTQCGLIKQVNMGRDSSRYCANKTEHAHFFCLGCGTVSDVDLEDPARLHDAFALEAGSALERLEVTLRGYCPTCASKQLSDESSHEH